MKLDNMFLDGRKIFANISKFGRGVFSSVRNRTKARGGATCNDRRINVSFRGAGLVGSKGFGKGSSYAEVTKGESSFNLLEFSTEVDKISRL